MKVINFFREKVSKIIILAIAIFILGGVITFYQNKLSKIDVPDKVVAIKSTNIIKKGHIITGKDLVEKEVYETDKLKGGITKMKGLIGKVALTTVVAGKEITEDEITTKDKWLKENEREVGIKFNHFTDIVGGKGKDGDVVDIMVSYNHEDFGPIKEPVCIVLAKEILQVMDDDNINYKTSKEKGSFKPTTAIFRLTEQEEKLIDAAKKQGRLYIRRNGNYIKTQEDKSKESTEESKSKVVITGN